MTDPKNWGRGSPAAPADREHLNDFEWTDALLREYADRARHVIDTLWSTDVAELEQADAGRCDECNTDTLVRFHYGRFTLCRTCARRRRRCLQPDAPRPTSFTWQEAA
jgi:hypothetical protein